MFEDCADTNVAFFLHGLILMGGRFCLKTVLITECYSYRNFKDAKSSLIHNDIINENTLEAYFQKMVFHMYTIMRYMSNVNHGYLFRLTQSSCMSHHTRHGCLSMPVSMPVPIFPL